MQAEQVRISSTHAGTDGEILHPAASVVLPGKYLAGNVDI